MLDRFEVKGFKSLADVAIDLGAVNVFIGANGSGKSNLLEAVGFLGAIQSGSSEFEAFRFRGIRPADSASFLCQLAYPSCNQIEFRATVGRMNYKVSTKIQGKTRWEIEAESVFFDQEEIAKLSGNHVLIQTENRKYALSPVIRASRVASIITWLQFVLAHPGFRGGGRPCFRTVARNAAR